MRARPGAAAGIRALIAVAIAIAIAIGSTAAAEPWRTTVAVTLRKRPGENQAAVAKLKAGTAVVVEATEGRWLRVRVGKQVGYLTRTTVSGGPPPAGGPSKAWSGKRRSDPTAAPSTELFVEVTAASSTLRTEARGDAAAVAELARGARLAVIEAPTAGWVHARDAEGHTGWIARAEIDDGAAAVAIAPAALAATAPKSTDTARSTELAPARGFTLRVMAGIGYRSLGMDFSSNGAGGLSNYLVSADASAAIVDVDAAIPVSARLRLGLDARLAVSRSWNGLDYAGPTGRPDTIPFSTLAADAGIRAGMRVGRAFELALRAGGHYDAFVVSDVDNTGMVPREQLYGVTIGGRADVTPPRSRISATARVDVLLIGTRGQTPGLEDGLTSTARALQVEIGFRFRLSRRFALGSAFELGRATTSWSGMSTRDPSSTSAHRVDSTQLVHIGLSAEL